MSIPQIYDRVNNIYQIDRNRVESATLFYEGNSMHSGLAFVDFTEVAPVSDPFNVIPVSNYSFQSLKEPIILDPSYADVLSLDYPQHQYAYETTPAVLKTQGIVNGDTLMGTVSQDLPLIYDGGSMPNDYMV
jgi:hypothetical protein